MNTPLMSVFIPLTPFAHQNAQKCAANQFTPEDRKLTYLKVLAIHALQDYLLYEHDLESEANRHYLDWPGLSDAATLYLPMLDREIECCPVLADDESFTLSQLTLERCAAHVAVRFSDDLTEAELLGFSPAVDPNDPPDCIYLEELLPIASLHQRLEEVARIVAWLNTDNPLTQELKALVAEAEQIDRLRHLLNDPESRAKLEQNHIRGVPELTNLFLLKSIVSYLQITQKPALIKHLATIAQNYQIEPAKLNRYYYDHLLPLLKTLLSD